MRKLQILVFIWIAIFSVITVSSPPLQKEDSIPEKPKIKSVNNKDLRVRDKLIIYGVFGDKNNKVRFNNDKLTVKSESKEQITAQTPNYFSK